MSIATGHVDGGTDDPSNGRCYGAFMARLGPLKFKYQNSEIVFRRDAVEKVELCPSNPAYDRRYGRKPSWYVQVNGQTVAHHLSESPARKKFERALRYVQ